MKRVKTCLVAVVVSLASISIGPEKVKAECASYSVRDSQPMVQLRMYKYQVGTEAFSILWNLSWLQAGMIIGAQYNYFGDCSYPGIGRGFGSGSGSMNDGVYPNDASVTYSIYGGGVDINTARAAIYAAISASSDPAPTTTTTSTTVSQSSEPPQTATNSTSSSPTPSSQSIVQNEEDDGEVIEDFAELVINQSGNRFVIEINSSFPGEMFTVRARIGSRRSVVWRVQTDSSGYRRIITSRNLFGYSVSLWRNGERFDLVAVQ